MKLLLSIIIAISLTACVTNPYFYHVEPTPLKRHHTKYQLKNVTVNLTLGHGAIPASTQFASQAELKEQFTDYLTHYLQQKNILAETPTPDTPMLEIAIDYKRKFNYGGTSLNKPIVSHSVVVLNESEPLASFRARNYTTKYAYLKDAAVNFEITAFSWDEEDEPTDLKLISEMIINDLANLGS